jgi:hypothetical protein
VNSGADVDLGVPPVGVLLFIERLDMALALLVDIVDHPGVSFFALGRSPAAFADRHRALPWVAHGAMLHVAFKSANSNKLGMDPQLSWPNQGGYRKVVAGEIR